MDGEATSQPKSSSVAESDRILSTKKEFADLFASSETELMIKRAAVGLLLVLGCSILWAIGGLLLILKTFLWLSIGASLTACLLALWMWRNALLQFRVNQESAQNNQQSVRMLQIAGITSGGMAAILLLVGAYAFQGAFLTVSWILGFLVPISLVALINDARLSRRTEMLVKIGAFGAFAVLGLLFYYKARSEQYKARSEQEYFIAKLKKEGYQTGIEAGEQLGEYFNAMLKKDFQTANKAAEQVENRYKDLGVGEYLTAHSLLESGQLTEALAKADVALRKNARREHGMQRARILYRMGRDSDGDTARNSASKLPFGKWSESEWPDACYYIGFFNSIRSVFDRLDFLRTGQNYDGFHSLLGEVNCLDAPSKGDDSDSLSRVFALGLYLHCLKNSDWKSADALFRAMSGKQQEAIVKIKQNAVTASGIELAVNNVLCWASCLAKQESLANVPSGDFGKLRAVLQEIENSATESQRTLISVLAKFKSSANATSGSNPELVTFSATNIRLLEEYANSCRQLRNWTYSTEALKRRTDSGEVLVEVLIRGYFGDIAAPIKEYQGSRDSAFIEFSRIIDNLRDIERRRSELYSAPNGVLDKHFGPKDQSKMNASASEG